jgi:hypothetical protein
VIAWVAELFLSTPAAATTAPAATHVIAEVTVGSAITAAAVLPAFLGFAEPAKRGAAARIVFKQLLGVIVCGALLALGNWIFTQCSKQWIEAGLPGDLPLMVSRPGGGAMPAAGQTPAGGAVRIGGTASSTAPKDEWYRQYTD